MTRTSRAALLRTGFLGAAMLLIAALDGVFGVLAPAIRANLSVGDRELSWIFSANLTGFLLFTPVGGLINGKKGFRTTFLVGFLAVLAAGGSLFLAGGIPLVCGSSFLLGAGVGLLTITANTVIPAVAGPSAVVLLNLFHLVYAGGAAASKQLFGSLSAAGLDWRLLVAAAALLSLLPLLALRFVPLPPPQPPEPGCAGLTALWKNPVFWKFSLLSGCYLACESLTANWLVSYSVSLGLNTARASACLSFFFVAAMFGKLVFPTALRRFRLHRALAVFALLAAGITLGGVLLGTGGLWMIAGAGLFFSILYPSTLAAANQAFPAHTAASVSFVVTCGSCLNLLLNLAFGPLNAALGARLSYCVIPVLLVCFAAIVALRPRQNRA